jgi:hypothetical protein
MKRSKAAVAMFVALVSAVVCAGTASAHAGGHSYYWDELTVTTKVSASLWSGRHHVLMANCNGFGRHNTSMFGPSFTRFQCEFTRKDFSSFHGVLWTTGPSTFVVTNIQN